VGKRRGMNLGSPYLQEMKNSQRLVWPTMFFYLAIVYTLASSAVHAEVSDVCDGNFTSDTVKALAKQLSQAPYLAPQMVLPKELENLDYDQYRDIRSNPTATIWGEQSTYFRLQVLSRGFIFRDSVEMTLVKNGRCHPIRYDKKYFTTGTVMKSPMPSEEIGFSGFRILFPIHRFSVFDEVGVFQGASYFRSLGANQVYGVSARGLAVKTAEPEGEEFPAFRAFWIEEPARASKSLVIYALLDSPSVTAAFRFTLHPGQKSLHSTTFMDVEATLYPRVILNKVGIAPGTSMFYFSPNGRVAIDDFRNEVHDSDGLLIFNGYGERIWRPLANPKKVEVSVFVDENPLGFGLLQRERDPQNYQDLEALYEQRPSLWVEPMGLWGKGSVVLIEIPSNAEIHDNIVAFWRPDQPLAAGVEHHFAYRLWWGDVPALVKKYAWVAATRQGRGDSNASTPLRRFIIDYKAAEDISRESRKKTLPEAVVSTTAGAIKNVDVQYNPIMDGYRVSYIFDPAESSAAELRVDLKPQNEQQAEVWIYRWTQQ
jgi:glucans biosynthesis protein